MLDEIRTFVTLTEAGSVQRAAERLYLTPSAVSRQIQRLEAYLGAPLLDRRVKPATVTHAGQAVLEHGRRILRTLDDLRATASDDAEPSGAFRIGLAHALAQPGVVPAIHNLATRFSRLRPALTTGMSQRLAEQVAGGELDVALTLVSSGHPSTSAASASVIAEEEVVVIRGRARGADRGRGAQRGGQHGLDGPWVVGPIGCQIRQSLELRLREMGVSLNVAAEIHNADMQLSLVASGLGLGILPARVYTMARRRGAIERMRVTLGVTASIVLHRASHLGPLRAAADCFEQDLRTRFSRTRR